MAHTWKAAMKALIREVFFRTGWYTGNYHALEKLFRSFRDPWNFEHSPYEKERMDILVAIIRQYPHASILEVGCAEGVFTARLANIARKVVALDVSPTAIERARQRCPAVTFLQAGIEEYETTEVFDIVLCSETLYYVKDVDGVLEKISRLGRYCLVSYLHRESKRLDSRLVLFPLLEFKSFEKYYGLIKYSMHVGVWKNVGVLRRTASPAR